MMVAMRTEAPAYLVVPLGLVVVSVLAMCVVILVVAYRDRKKPRTSKLHAFDYPAAFRPHLPQCTRYEDGVCACDEQPDVIAVESFAIDYSPSSGLAVVVIDGGASAHDPAQRCGRQSIRGNSHHNLRQVMPMISSAHVAIAALEAAGFQFHAGTRDEAAAGYHVTLRRERRFASVGPAATRFYDVGVGGRVENIRDASNEEVEKAVKP
jgi:hypothetical protein